MPNEFMSEIAKSSIAITPTAGAAGQTAINGAILDMAGFTGVEVSLVFGAITSGAVTSLKAQQGAASNLSDAADLTGTSISVADTDDGKLFVLDVKNVQERYFRVVVSRATQDAVVAAGIYKQYGPRTRPITQHADVITNEKHLAPIEGTA